MAPTTEGDLLVPSGEQDGTARAVASAEYTPVDGPIVGRAWEGSDEAGVDRVTVAVGLETGEALAAAVTDQQAAIDDLRTELQGKDDRIEDLEAANEGLRERLAALEAQVGSAGPAPADD